MLIEIPKNTLKLPKTPDAIRMGVSPHGLWVETHDGGGDPTSARLYHTLPRPADTEWVAAGSLDHSALHYAGGALSQTDARYGGQRHTALLLDGEHTGLELEGLGASAYAPCWLERKYEKVEIPKTVLIGALRLQKLFASKNRKPTPLTLALTQNWAYLAHRKFIIRLSRSGILCEIDPRCDHTQLLPDLRSHEVYLNVHGWWAQPKGGRRNAYAPHLEFRPNQQPPSQSFEIEESFAEAATLRQPDEHVTPWYDLKKFLVEPSYYSLYDLGHTNVPTRMLGAIEVIFKGHERCAQARTFSGDKPVMFENFNGIAVMLIVP